MTMDCKPVMPGESWLADREHCKNGAFIGHTGLSGYNLNIIEYLFPRENLSGGSLIYMQELIKTWEFQGKPHPIKAMYIHSNNPVCNATNQNKIVNTIFPAIEFIVVVDPIETETAKYADIVLPGTHWFETVEFVQGPIHQPPPYLKSRTLIRSKIRYGYLSFTVQRPRFG